MSVSKTFCGATAALMAADGKFGAKKMDATLLDVLDEAAAKHPERSEDIEKYREMILKKGCGAVTMSQLLSHRSGLIQGDGYFKPGNLSNLEVYNNVEILHFDSSKTGNTFSYCNPAFVLAEDMMGLVADSDKGYYGELQSRIIEPIKLTHTKSIYESEESKKAASEVVKIEGVIYDWGVASKETARRSPLEENQKGRVALSEGGLCSSVGDLEKFYGELAKLACGMPNLLQSDLAKTREIHGFYRDDYKAAKTCKSDSARALSMHCATHYSLGVIIEAVDSEGKTVLNSRGEEGQRSQIRFQHIGNQPGNDAAVSATMPFSFAEFTSGTASLKESKSPELSASISQKDVLAKDSLLTIVSCDYIEQMDKCFSGKCDRIEDPTYNDEWRAYNQYWEAARTGEPVAKDWQAALIDEGRLPKNFGELHDQIRAAYAPAQEALVAYFKEHFCDEAGVVDREKVKEIRTAEDFAKIKEAIEPLLQESRKTTQEIFAKSDQQLGEQLESESGSFAKKIKPSKAIAAGFTATFADQMQSEDGGSFVERLGLKKPEESKSFVEVAQAGRDRSNGDTHKL
jgi:CubicO group peptidase (beta-lactamase class C family)